MRLLSAILIAFALLASAVPLAKAQNPELTFQRINVMVAHHDNRFSLRVWPDGQAEMRFPFYAARAGHYRWQLEPSELADLRTHFRAVNRIDPDQLRSNLSARSSEQLIVVADADLLRFAIADGRGPDQDWMIESAVAWHQALPDLEPLAELAELEEHLFDWMQAKAQELQP